MKEREYRKLVRDSFLHLKRARHNLNRLVAGLECGAGAAKRRSGK